MVTLLQRIANMEESICEIVRKMEADDANGVTQLSEYVSVNMREDINRTEAYINSKHISGDTDYLGREKPFFDIVTQAVNIWYRATDIDRKNISIRATNQKQVIPAFLATIKLQEWMKREEFGRFLNKWGLTLARHGSAVLEIIENGNELHCSVLDWNSIIIDPIDFENNLLIKKIWMTPAQLRKQKNYDQTYVEELIEHTSVRETIDGKKKDNKDNYILVYEVHGEFPLELITEDEKDSETYVQQMHAVSFVKPKSGNSDEYQDYTLFSGRLKKRIHVLTHLLEKDGQTYTGGAVKNLFEAQWMINHSQKQIKDHLDLASKIIFQTSDESVTGQNVLTNIENGQILKHKINEPVTMLNNKPDITSMQAFKADWQNIANQINNISESLMGNAAPSGTAWRQVQALLQESHSLFELMVETKGLYLEKILREYILPFFMRQLDNTDEISAKLDDYLIKQIDLMYLPNEIERRLNKKKKDIILSGGIYDPTQEPMDRTTIEQAVKGNLFGNQRFISPSEVKKTTWKKLFEDLDFTIDIDITGEAKDTQAALATLSTVLQVISNNPSIFQDPHAKLVLSKLLNLTGTISPLELDMATQQQPTQPMQPMQPMQQSEPMQQLTAGTPTNQ